MPVVLGSRSKALALVRVPSAPVVSIYFEQILLTFITGAVQLNSSLLTLSVIAVLLPAAFHSSLQPKDGSVNPLTNRQEGQDILSISHGVSIFS